MSEDGGATEELAIWRMQVRRVAAGSVGVSSSEDVGVDAEVVVVMESQCCRMYGFACEVQLKGSPAEAWPVLGWAGLEAGAGSFRYRGGRRLLACDVVGW